MDAQCNCLQGDCTGPGAGLLKALLQLLPRGWFPPPPAAKVAEADRRAARELRRQQRLLPIPTPPPPTAPRRPGAPVLSLVTITLNRAGGGCWPTGVYPADSMQVQTACRYPGCICTGAVPAS